MPPGAEFAFSTADPLFDGTKYVLPNWWHMFDISADGQQFLMVKRPNADDATERASLTVVTHWFEELTAAMKGK